MTLSVAFLLSMTFLISVGGLALLIWAAANDQFGMGQDAAKTIFAAGEVGQIEDPATSGKSKLAMQRERGVAPAHSHDEDEELQSRATADRSSRIPVLAWLTSAIVWLIIGSLFGLISSIKMHAPDWLVHDAFLTFGRVRPAHLNIVAYGWASMAGVGVAMWLIPRLFKTSLVGGNYATAGAVIWNIGMIAGTAALLSGLSTGLEWLEFPWYAALALTVAGGLAAVPLILTALQRRVTHLYVSTWYLIAALVWFPMLFITANMPGLFAGVDQALMNWWFAHNVLGLWMTPLGLAAAYYFIPKIVGEPIYSYSLSLIGFWALALFYSQVGLHHLIGGPVPTWAVTISIVHSMMMLVPVIAVAVNQHMTVAKHFRLLKYSPTLRFVTLGAMMYTFASVQGSFEALRTINTVTHFTHYTVAHAHMGVYGFFSFVMFGSIYFIVPRVTNWEWPYPWAISLHFWLSFVGFGIYFWLLSIGGWLQGLAMLDASRPFMDSVTLTIPYLVSRSVGGTLMTLGHLVFGIHFFIALRHAGPVRQGPAILDTELKSEGAIA